MAMRLSLVVHYFQDSPRTHLEADIAQIGCRLARYFVKTHKELLFPIQESKDEELIDRVAKTISRHGDCNMISIREVVKRNSIPMPELKALVARQHGTLEILKIPPPQGRGRPRHVIELKK